MGRNKKYDGYKAFQYLKAGLDYKEFKLVPELNRVSPYFIPLKKTEEERFENIIKKNLVIDLHEHPVLWPEDMSQAMDLKRMGRDFLAYEALSVSGIDCIFDHLMDGTAYITSYNGWKWTDVIHDIGIRLSDIYHQKMVTSCYKIEEIKEAHKEGKVALVLCLESATPIENELDRIDVLYGLGVRSIGICYSESNMLGGGMSETNKTTGLSDFGYDAVKRMNKLGMLIDVGHTNDITALETIDASDKPIYNSHSGPASFAKGHVMSDEAIIAMAEKGGLIGIGGAGRGLTTKKHPLGSIESYMEVIEYCIKLVGIDHVGCGPDSLYGDHQELYRYWFSRQLGHHVRPNKISQPRQQLPAGFVDPGYVKGLENPNEFINVARWMVKNGYSDQEVNKLIGLNAINLLEKTW